MLFNTLIIYYRTLPNFADSLDQKYFVFQSHKVSNVLINLAHRLCMRNISQAKFVRNHSISVLTIKKTLLKSS